MALPAYDQCIKASHVFNLLDARGVISVTERQSYILRVRELAKACGEAWVHTEAGRAVSITLGEQDRRPSAAVGSGRAKRPSATSSARLPKLRRTTTPRYLWRHLRLAVKGSIFEQVASDLFADFAVADGSSSRSMAHRRYQSRG